MDKKKDSRLYNKNFGEAWKNAFSGIIYAFKTQRNLRIQLIAGIIVVILGIVLKISPSEWAILSLSVFFVLGSEMMNTALETVVDLNTEEYHIKAKWAKDTAAGAVVLASINAVVVSCFLFADKIIQIFNK